MYKNLKTIINKNNELNVKNLMIKIVERFLRIYPFTKFVVKLTRN